MRIFALETNIETLTKRHLSAEESLIVTVRFHGFLFFVRCILAFFLTCLIVVLAVGMWYLSVPYAITLALSVLAWLIFVVFPLLRAFIDWRFDLLMVTSEKLVIVNQSSLFHAEVHQMNLDNIASVRASTQFWNIVPFGKICFDLKEGVGQQFCLKYIPQADRIAQIVSDAVIVFQRRRAAMGKQVISVKGEVGA